MYSEISIPSVSKTTKGSIGYNILYAVSSVLIKQKFYVSPLWIFVSSKLPSSISSGKGFSSSKWYLGTINVISF